MIADPLLALLVAGLTLYRSVLRPCARVCCRRLRLPRTHTLWRRSTFPLFSQTAKILLQTTPRHLKTGLERCRREVTTIPGVLECKDEHFWTQAPGTSSAQASAWGHAALLTCGGAGAQGLWWEALSCACRATQMNR